MIYLHLGQNVVVPTSEILGIFDLDNTTGSKITRDFLKTAEKTGRIINISDDLPKSFVVCGENENIRVYLSQLSPATLLKRSETMNLS